MLNDSLKVCCDLLYPQWIVHILRSIMTTQMKFQDDFTVILVKTHLCLEGKNYRLFMTLWGSIQTDFQFIPVRFFVHSIPIIYTII
jgi:hypothetical protein